jgi:hypothetical protein
MKPFRYERATATEGAIHAGATCIPLLSRLPLHSNTSPSSHVPLMATGIMSSWLINPCLSIACQSTQVPIRKRMGG